MTAAGKKLGSGANFRAIEKSARASGARNPGAVAYMAGKKAHGKKAMARYSAMGRRRKSGGKKAKRKRHLISHSTHPPHPHFNVGR
jgi:hypothetical protein